jgi:hypothetical protein
MAFQKSISDFKAVLQGGGVRPTMFQVEITFPAGVSADGTDAADRGQFLIKAAQLPPSNVGVIDVPFRGRKLKVSGDRSFADWNVQVINDTSFTLRKTFEKWAEKIQNHNYALGATQLSDYYASAIVRQLDRDGTQLRSYGFQGIWPSSVGEIALDFGTNDTHEEYDVTFCVQWWNAIEEGDPYTSAVARDPQAAINAVTS